MSSKIKLFRRLGGNFMTTIGVLNKRKDCLPGYLLHLDCSAEKKNRNCYLNG